MPVAQNLEYITTWRWSPLYGCLASCYHIINLRQSVLITFKNRRLRKGHITQIIGNGKIIITDLCDGICSVLYLYIHYYDSQIPCTVNENTWLAYHLYCSWHALDKNKKAFIFFLVFFIFFYFFLLRVHVFRMFCIMEIAEEQSLIGLMPFSSHLN